MILRRLVNRGLAAGNGNPIYSFPRGAGTLSLTSHSSATDGRKNCFPLPGRRRLRDVCELPRIGVIDLRASTLPLADWRLRYMASFGSQAVVRQDLHIAFAGISAVYFSVATFEKLERPCLD